MGATLTLKTTGLRNIAAKMGNPAVRDLILRIPHEKAIAALVGQAIGDNFEQEGPGWAPLKPSTIRQSVNKKLRGELSEMTDEELLKYEAKARRKGSENEPYRKILQRTGLLKKTATIPGYVGSSKPKGKKGGKTVEGGNIWKVEGTKLIWGTNLPYAAVHQKGDAKRHIPARPYLTLRDKWKVTIFDYFMKRAFKYITESLVRGGA